ncbi:YTH domain-containing protein ECT4-like isoform X1 [Trifolium pratense]|uniref:YTH domain-containing protein ECT4-like isoform X1 n=1 Tax=Trifolium pratense TaxID=57577 RepID=UPI001E6904CC|nr:YTH domain-containing protein ECT4-like isoform X1 [Trifolium pratense]
MADESKKAADEMNKKKLHGDSSTAENNNSNMVPSKGGGSSPPSEARSCVSSLGDASGSFKEGDVDHEYQFTDQNVPYAAGSYYGYYYPGYGGFYGEPENQGYYVGAADAVDFQYPVMQADNGSYVYLMPGYQTGYSSYIPVNTPGVDGQYQFYPPGSVYQQPIGSPGYFPASLPYAELFPSTYSWDSSLTTQDVSHGNRYNEFAGKPSSRSNFSSQTHTGSGVTSKSVPSSTVSNSSDAKGSSPLLDVSSIHVKRNQPKQANKASISGPVLHSDTMAKGSLPVAKFSAYNQAKSGFPHQNNLHYAKANTKGWVSTEKLKLRSKVNDPLNEQNHGPRTANVKGEVNSGANSARTVAVDKSGNGDSKVRTDQYNLPDFPTTYDHALFFVIKSYSEDDVHKSIKYNVWASTPNGNKRLDNAFQDAQNRMESNGSKCPVFLFFSVNASGQFCGVAEMIGRVDFNKSMDFWQQDKWNGYFPVKWHIIKDIPNPQLRHIILENNDHKPVTNSRDTQEVHFPQGIEMLNIFKNYVSKTSILEDFDFYEGRQKVMQEKKIRQPMMHHTNTQHIDDLTSALGSVDISTVKNMEDPKLAEKVND